MVDSTRALYILQEIVFDARLKQPAELNEIRVQLKQCWDDAKELLQECYALTSTVSLMENEASMAKSEQMMTLVNELVKGCEKCHGKAQDLANRHSIPMKRYEKFEATLRHLVLSTGKQGRNQGQTNEVAMSEAMSTFASAYKTLQERLDDMVKFFTGEVQTCNQYLNPAQGSNTGVISDQAGKFSMKWMMVRPIIKRAKAKFSRVRHGIAISSPGALSPVEGRVRFGAIRKKTKATVPRIRDPIATSLSGASSPVEELTNHAIYTHYMKQKGKDHGISSSEVSGRRADIYQGPGRLRLLSK
jgi:hypothetical protein